VNKLQFKYSPYTLKLNTPFSTSKGIINEREGFIISIRNSNRIEGTGDSAPFPEFGSETLQNAEKALNKLKLNVNLNILNIKKSMSIVLKDFDSLPALRHGIEQALLNLICEEKNITLNELLGIKLKNTIDVNGVIGFLTLQESVERVKELVQIGFSTIKVKVGRDNFDEDLNSLERIRGEIGNEVKLRIDVNGKWSLNEAINNLKKLETLYIEYAEQPVSLLKDFIDLKQTTIIPLAADESIRDKKSAEEFIKSSAVDYLILKPMMIGGLIPTLEIIDLAEKNNIITVITSSFESAIGRTNAIIAAAYTKSKIAHGLAVQQYFEKDLIEDHYLIKEGKIYLTRNE
jgi:o-succinylbenzoate synthase